MQLLNTLDSIGQATRDIINADGNPESVTVTITADEWRALRFATLMLVDVTMNAPLIEGPGHATRSDKMKGRRAAARLRDEVMRISNELGLEPL